MHRIAPFLLPLAALAFGCADSDPAPAGDQDAGIQRDTGGNNEGCVSDLECAGRQVCVAGMCRPGECNRDRMCPVGQTCNAALFVCSGNEVNACTGNEQCDGGFCIQGECRDVQCVEDTDCDLNETCTAQFRCISMPAGCSDGDGDGYGAGCEAGPDCDDARADVNSGQVEDGANLCSDGVDHDCNGSDPECGEVDADGDGVTDREGDCDDSDPAVNPNANEIPYNGKDDDCDPTTLDDDVDRDGFRGTEVGGDDCDDRAVHINPEARDIPGNGVDEDCDGSDRMPSGDDADGDGVSESDGDCNDENAAVFPGADEVPYNGIDDDCSAETPDNDLDGDGFDSPVDCDDAEAAVNPNAPEVYYNGRDDDCDPTTDDSDADGDGFAGIVDGGDDCNDEAAGINPGAEEQPYNGADDDCNPVTRDDDLDSDGFARADDCADDDPTINPDAVENATTLCSDGIDHDCRGGDVECDAEAPDGDGDGVPDDQDCAPDNAAIPGPMEIPGNGLDDDCNPMTPDEVAMCDDDVFDAAMSNDDSATATAVEDGNTRGAQFGDLVFCGGEDDWYRIDLEAGDGLEVDVNFIDEEADVDVLLFKGDDLAFVDASSGVGDRETVYTRRANEAATYYIRVFRFQPEGRSTYQMTVNVFQGCMDDAKAPGGEHNDSQDEATSIPAAGSLLTVCDFDDDWYAFTIDAEQDVRLDLLFTDADGDVDMLLFREGNDVAIARATSSSDNEVIEETLAAGRYFVRVYTFRDDTNTYRFFRTSGETASVDRSMPGADVDIPDFSAGTPGLAEVNLDFEAPAGAVIRSLTVRDLDINHSFLRDLRVSLLWDGEVIAVIWNRQGDPNGSDGGEDDDFLPFTGGDINFDNRMYPAFVGLSANGQLTLRVEDLAVGDTGEIADFDVRVEYLVP